MFRSFQTNLIIAFLVLSFSGLAAAQADKAKQIDAFIRPFVEAQQFYGVVLASENGKIIYEKPFGYANADFRIPNSPETRIGGRIKHIDWRGANFNSTWVRQP